MRRRPRSANVPTVDFDVLLARLPDLRQRHDICVSTGMAVTRARMRRERNGAWTLRVVWRGRKADVRLAFTHETRGLVLA